MFFQWPWSWSEIVNYPKDQPLMLSINLFRYREPAFKKPDWDGVLMVMNTIDWDPSENKQHSSATTSSSIPDTCDLAKLLE